MKPGKKVIGLAFFALAIVSLILIRHGFTRPENLASPAPTKQQLTLEQRKEIANNFCKIPLHFELNQGQTDSDVQFISRSGNHALLLKQNESQLVLPNRKMSPDGKSQTERADVLKMSLAGANESTIVEGLEALPGRTNYFMGNDPAKWQSEVPTYKKVKYSGVYEGIDLVYYGNQQQLEYDFVVAPHADPGVIALSYENASDLKVDKRGDLLVRVGKHDIRQHAPVTYQEVDGVRNVIESKYVVRRNNSASKREVGIAIGEYDSNKPLIIDPVIVFSTYLGGSAGDDLFTIEAAFTILTDASGNIYVGGITPSPDFPTLSAQQPGTAGGYDAFITKFNPTGTALLYSSFFGGSDEDRIISMSLGPSNELFVGGLTWSTNFPMMTAFQTTNRGLNDAYIARFASNGALTYSSYIGGSGQDSVNYVKNEGSSVMTFVGSTGSGDFPTANAIQPNFAGGVDFFVGKINLTTNVLQFSTFLGGMGSEGMIFSSAAVDQAGNIYVGGVSNSADYPTTPNSFQPENNGSDDVVITKLNPSGSAIIYSTYIGGNLIDSADALAVDSGGNAFVTGFTRSANYPLKNPAQSQLKDPDAFVTKLNPSGTALVFSTYLGGLNLERGSGIAVDPAGNSYVTGRSNSGDFPAKRSLRPPRGLDDVFISRFNRDGALLFSTLLGGASNDYGFAISADNSNNAYVAGRASRLFFTTPGAFQGLVGGNADAFVAKINTSVRKVKSDFDGDGKSDISVFRPNNGVWYLLHSGNSTTRFEAFGQNGDVPVPGDYDGDAKTDLAVFRPSAGAWYILNSRTNTFRSLFWGISTDKAVPGDYDGDDKTDVAIYRPSTGAWLIVLSSTNGLQTITFGLPGDKPVPADYDGDAVTDVAVYNPNNGAWSIVGSFGGIVTQQFGLSSDKPVPADYDGDGYDDIAVFRPSQGIWYVLRSGSGNAFSVFQWGLGTDIASPADYDGDGKEDFAVFRPSGGNWYVSRSSDNSLLTLPFGTNGDIPIESTYVPQ